MIQRSGLSRLVSGTFAIIVIVSASACAAPTVKNTMHYQDLSNFVIDCSKKQEQIIFLQSQRLARDDKLWNWVQNYVKGWEAYTDPAEYKQRKAHHSGYHDWLINQNLLELGRQC